MSAALFFAEGRADTLNAMNTKILKSVCFTLVAGLALGALAGCATASAPVAFSTAPRLTGKIVRVNDRDEYVVAECSVLPSPGEEATVMRGDRRVGRIRFSDQMRPQFAVADILEGLLLPGDRWRVDRDGSDALLEQKL